MLILVIPFCFFLTLGLIISLDELSHNSWWDVVKDAFASPFTLSKLILVIFCVPGFILASILFWPITCLYYIFDMAFVFVSLLNRIKLW